MAINLGRLWVDSPDAFSPQKTAQAYGQIREALASLVDPADLVELTEMVYDKIGIIEGCSLGYEIYRHRVQVNSGARYTVDAGWRAGYNTSDWQAKYADNPDPNSFSGILPH
jgi:hypothetical protein